MGTVKQFAARKKPPEPEHRDSAESAAKTLERMATEWEEFSRSDLTPKEFAQAMKQHCQTMAVICRQQSKLAERFEYFDKIVERLAKLVGELTRGKRR